MQTEVFKSREVVFFVKAKDVVIYIFFNFLETFPFQELLELWTFARLEHATGLIFGKKKFAWPIRCKTVNQELCHHMLFK